MRTTLQQGGRGGHVGRQRLGVVAAACLLLTACTGGAPAQTDEAASNSGPGSITYLIEEPEEAATLSALKTRLGEFTTESGIAVDLRTLPTDTMRTVLQTQLRSGEGPDVFAWGSGPGFGGALARAGLVRDLTAAYEENDWQVYDFAKERVTVDGKVYGLPGEAETLGVFYNKEIFTELGLSEPKSLADLEAVSAKVRQSGRTPMAVGDKEGWPGGHLLSMALSSAIGPDGMQELFDGKRSWDSPEVVAALQVWKDFEQAGTLPKSPTSVDYDDSTSLFFSGDAAMIPTGSWLVDELNGNADFEVGYIPFPAPDGPGIFTGGLGSGPYVSATTQNADESIRFLDFLASPEHARWMAEKLQTIPPREVDTKGLQLTPLFAQVLDNTAGLAQSGDFGYNIDVMVPDAVNEALYDGMQAVFTGQQTPQEVAAALEAART